MTTYTTRGENCFGTWVKSWKWYEQSLQTHQNEFYLKFNIFIVVSVGNPLQGIMTLSYIREMFTRPREYLFEWAVLQKHVIYHEETIDWFPCDTRGNKFYSINVRLCHIKTSHSTTTGNCKFLNFECKLCDFKSTLKGNLKTHKEVFMKAECIHVICVHTQHKRNLM